MKRHLRGHARETVEMADHRKYFSDDGWKTVWQARGMPNGSSHRKVLDSNEADFVRYIVVSQSSWQGDAF